MTRCLRRRVSNYPRRMRLCALFLVGWYLLCLVDCGGPGKPPGMRITIPYNLGRKGEKTGAKVLHFKIELSQTTATAAVTKLTSNEVALYQDNEHSVEIDLAELTPLNLKKPIQFTYSVEGIQRIHVQLVDPPYVVKLPKVTGNVDPTSSPGTIVGGLSDLGNLGLPRGRVSLLSDPDNMSYSDSYGLFTLDNVPIDSNQVLVASAEGYLTTLEPIATCANGNATPINLISLEQGRILTYLGQLSTLGMVGGTLRTAEGYGIAGATVTISPSTGKERILYFNPATGALSNQTTVLPGDPLDGSFAILNVDPSLGPFTVSAFDVSTGQLIAEVENVTVQVSNLSSSGGRWTQVIFEPLPCPNL